MEIKFNKTIPELSVTDINKSKEFYIKLGFKVLYERKENNFCFLELEENQIMIEQINGNWNVGIMERPFGRGVNISMSVEDVEGLYNNVLNKKLEIFKEIEVHQYKVDDTIFYDKEFLIQDPDGYLLRFND